MSNPTYYITPSAYALVAHDAHRVTINLGFDPAAARAELLMLPGDVTIKVVKQFPWRQYVRCIDCGHTTTAFGCEQGQHGLRCPRCHVEGGMAPVLDTTRHQQQHVDIFERDGQWFWAVDGNYPWGPFPTREDAEFDAEVTR